MTITSPSQVRMILDEYRITPKRSLGQNFLIDGNIRDLILSAAEVNSRDIVLEIGSGIGALTEKLASMSCRVIAVEKDIRCYEYLLKRFNGTPMDLRHMDALGIDWEKEVQHGVTIVVSNLPYSAGCRILMNIFEAQTIPERIVVTVQREVAERLMAEAGKRDRGMLSVLAQMRYFVKLVHNVSPTCFFPKPEIMSSIIKLTRRPSTVDIEHMRYCAGVVKELFRFRRKQIGTSVARLAAQLGIPLHMIAQVIKEACIAEQSRPETLTNEDWMRLADCLKSHASAGRAINAGRKDMV